MGAKQEKFIFDLVKLVMNRVDFFTEHGHRPQASILAFALLNCFACYCDNLEGQPDLSAVVEKVWDVLKKDKDYARKEKQRKIVLQKLVKRNPTLAGKLQM